MDVTEPGILLVEDQAIIALHEERVLREAGYQVTTAHTGKKAIEIMKDTTREAPVDLILMDIDLGPGMDGTEAAREILRTRNVPILFLSGHTEKEIVNKAEEISCYGYVVKTAGPVVLLASVRMALRLHHSERRFHSVLSQVRDVAVQGYAADGTTVYWNDASQQLYGFSREEAVGEKLWNLIIPSEMVSSVKQSVHRMVTTETPVPPQNLLLLHKDGKRVHVRSNHSITRNAAGKAELFCLDIPLD